jgi:orotidine-5'-phosphate decarboxylase
LVASFGSRLKTVFQSRGQLCVGIDPSQQQLEAWSLTSNVSGLERFSFGMLDAVADTVGIVKPQVAFFEQFGSAGFAVLERLCEAASRQGLIVIADAKRGDIGSTMDGYSSAWLSKTSPFATDALTVSSYLGPESTEGMVQVALENGKGIFLLAATSNPEAIKMQSSKFPSGETIASMIAEFTQSINNRATAEATLGSIGLVVGANLQRESYGLSDGTLGGLPILAPGFGFQGAQLSKLRSIFGELSSNVICSVSRSISGDSAKSAGLLIKQAVLELNGGIEDV